MDSHWRRIKDTIDFNEKLIVDDESVDLSFIRNYWPERYGMVRDIGPRSHPAGRYEIRPYLPIPLLIWYGISMGYLVRRYIYRIVLRDEISVGYSKFKGAK